MAHCTMGTGYIIASPTLRKGTGMVGYVGAKIKNGLTAGSGKQTSHDRAWDIFRPACCVALKTLTLVSYELRSC